MFVFLKKTLRTYIIYTQKKLSNNNGTALLYILAAFLIISFIGTTMIKMSAHEMQSSSDHSAAETAIDAARSGLIATKSFIENASDSTINILLDYINDSEHKPQWILGNENSFESVDNYLQYRTQLLNLAYDPNKIDNNFVATIRSEGYGKGNSRKRIISVLQLNDLNWNNIEIEDILPTQTMYLAQGFGALNTQLIVNGDIYCDKTNGSFNNFTSGAQNQRHQFNGAFVGSERGASGINLRFANFNGPTYFDTKIIIQESVTFWNHLGVEGDIYIAPNKKFGVAGTDNNFYFNGSLSSSQWDSRIDMKGSNHIYACQLNTYRNNGSGTPIDWGMIFNPGSNSEIRNYETENVPQLIGLTDDQLNPPEPFINISLIPNNLIHDIKDISRFEKPVSANQLNEAYESYPLWNDFLVLKGSVKGDNSDLRIKRTLGRRAGEVFNKKLILIPDDFSRDTSAFKCGLPDVSDDGLILIYQNSCTGIYTGGTSFRGVIYAEDLNNPETSNYKIQFCPNSVPRNVKGAIIMRNGKFNLVADGNQRIPADDFLTITYDFSVLNELTELGLFTDQPITGFDEITLTSDNISTTELALQM